VGDLCLYGSKECESLKYSEYVRAGSIGSALVKTVKVNLSLFLSNEALCHENIWGSAGVALPFLMEMSGHLHAPPTLSPVLIE
jgi:hypothetical protein